MRSRSSLFLAALALVACAGRLPAGGTAADHQAAALRHVELAAMHERAARKAPPCGEVPGIYEVCWTRSDTPQAHRDLADWHRELAEAHAERARALRAAAGPASRG